MDAKAEAELAFWKSRPRQHGKLANDHYEYFFTRHFGFDREFYREKRILDIGCGPRGSLEWATDACERVGVDPLAEAYLELGARDHAMQYVASGAEHLPFADGSFDVVSSFNSLDHVDDLPRVVHEIGRVTAPGGYFLLITDIHASPTVMEPVAMSWDVVSLFAPALEAVEQLHVEQSVLSPEGFGDIYQSLRRAIPFDHRDGRERTGILSAKLRKRA